ncbi:AfsR/SARP family transcriptional regulator [Phytohabitans aurantiacus]|uniref:SARP family transcriptional regulator n=1 Tax=Phytohabitans aurantiacus TaxID=3016789 RepID=A0ABQ5QLU7_9ACTN|nr:BTAD domain-containing putative transcriptional regulator [Phytohabitans aurantiacus]GLH95207.1 SARP family transcriptional regulator [Phytohabitans aurantiacus]
MLDVRVLGALEVRANGEAVPLGSRKQQTVLAMLALHPSRVVGMDELIDELWPEAPPASAVANTRTYAANLRRLFDSAQPTRGLIAREASGYIFTIAPEQVDLFAFQAERHLARQARGAGDRQKAAVLLSAAANRWRGPVLTGVSKGPVLTARCAALEEERLDLVEELAELLLEQGQERGAAALLRDHVRLHPLRERAQGLLMRALAGTDDIAGALNAYALARTALIDQLGVEPGPTLRELHREVLRRDTSAASYPGTVNAPAPARRWLPRQPAHFTGRAELVARLLKETGTTDGPVIHAIDGMPGAGKTTFAVHIAHRLSEAYPDAQFFVDLQGHSDHAPLQTDRALATLLRQLGIPDGRVPIDLEERAALWQTKLAELRAVVVLDNAASSDQVLPLLPTSSGSVVLVTSRRRLTALDDASMTSLPMLDPDEALDLLSKIVGVARLQNQMPAAQEVVRCCGYLPLAIRLAGARLASRPGWQVDDLARRLRGQSHVLPELVIEKRSVKTVFAFSYGPLREPVKRMFRLLGLWPGERFDASFAAALSGMSIADAEAAITELIDCHLLDEPDIGQFRFHDLIHEYARDLVVITESRAEREAALEQLLDHYLHTVAAATKPLESVSFRSRIPLSQPMRPDLRPDEKTGDFDWLADERSNHRALVRSSTETGRHEYAWRLARTGWRFYYTRGFYDDIIETHQLGLVAAQKSGDDVGAATMQNYLASALLYTGRHEEALRCLDQAIAIYRAAGDIDGVSNASTNKSAIYLRLGKLEEAAEIAREELRRQHRDMDFIRICRLIPNLSLPLMYQGRYAEALRVNRMHLLIASEWGDSFQIGNSLFHIGAVRSRIGDHAPAIRLLRASLAVKRRTGNWFGEAEAHNELGVALRGTGDLNGAEKEHYLALQASEAANERYAVATALNDYGTTLSMMSNSAISLDMYDRALSLATRINYPYEQGRALAGIAFCKSEDDPAEARRLWQRAFSIFCRIGVPERHEVARRLEDGDRPYSNMVAMPPRSPGSS